MKRIRPSTFLSVLGMLLVLGLMAGCYRPAAPDVTPTVAGAAEAARSEEGTPDMAATAIAESTRVAEAAQETPTPTESPTEPPSTSTPTPTPTVAITPAPTYTPAPTSSASTPTPSATGQVTHKVQRGENLFRIALRYGTTVEAIARANGIANPSLIYAGQTLVVSSSGGGAPPPTTGGTTYTVQPGDNLFRIALRYNMSYMHLAQYNGLANPSHIYVGQVIRIP